MKSTLLPYSDFTCSATSTTGPQTRLWHSADVAPLFSSFQPAALQAAKEAVPDIPRALLLDSLRAGWFDEVQALGCVAVVTNYAVMDAETIARLHAAKLRALVYTVNDPAEAQRLLALGIDGIITDAVDRFSPVERAVHD